MMVADGRLRTRLNVSLILLVTACIRFQIEFTTLHTIIVTWSQAVLFQMLRMSSWNLMETTAPHTSSPTMNCSPSIARARFSQHRDARPGPGRYSKLFVCVGCQYCTFSQADDPLAAELVGLVLPHRLDAHLEQVEVGVAGEVPRLDEVAVQRPELLAAAEPPCST